MNNEEAMPGGTIIPSASVSGLWPDVATLRPRLNRQDAPENYVIGRDKSLAMASFLFDFFYMSSVPFLGNLQG